jgi:hypothetical protein
VGRPEITEVYLTVSTRYEDGAVRDFRRYFGASLGFHGFDSAVVEVKALLDELVDAKLSERIKSERG